jgi:D-lactate dehydrogenase
MKGNFHSGLSKILSKDRIKQRAIDRYAFASDASHFFMVPEVVVQPSNIEEVKALFKYASDHNTSLTFRAGGTSLSGQSCTDKILVDISRYWRSIEVLDQGKAVKVQPAVLGSVTNQVLKKFGSKIGPDPASINAAMIGGIVSNNSSGMCCGVHQNSYHTLQSIHFILPDGTDYDTSRKADYDRFLVESKKIAEGIIMLKREIRQNDQLMHTIKKKYLQKNTTGYGLNAFIDYDHPLDILSHLLVGAEGTLAFVAETIFNTVPDLPHKITGMLYFENPEAAGNAIPAMKSTGAEALEFMDRQSLRSVENMEGVPALLSTLPPRAAAVLVEFQAATEDAAKEKYEAALKIFDTLPLWIAPQFTKNPYEQAVLWKIRKGLYPSVAGLRAKRTSAMLEDLTFPTDRMGEAIVDIQKLFETYGYSDAIIFGHIKDGNLHFCLTQDFSSQAEIDRFIKMNDEIFDLVLKKYDGALKAEHGTGRAVAPYVEAEWGPEAYGIMKRLKNLIDPHQILNPDVIITEDKNTHLAHLKWMPIVEEEVDKCVECGFCERRCPSRDYTMTPRQRISVRRSLQRLKQAGDMETHASIVKDYQFDGMDTCAVDGMCATDCPVNINTGSLIKKLRKENHSIRANKRALFFAKNFSMLEIPAKIGVTAGRAMNKAFGNKFMPLLTQSLRKISSNLPLWSNHISAPGNPSSLQLREFKYERSVVYFSSCISRLMGGDIFQSMSSVCKKAKINIIFNKGYGSCCGQIFSSKGYNDAYAYKANEAIEKLWKLSKGGDIPIVLDVTSCTQTIMNSRSILTDENKTRFDHLKILDTIDFIHDLVLPFINISKKKTSIVFHPVCSVAKMNLQAKLVAIGSKCANNVDIPESAGCCGMAGDRGFYFPDLTSAATKLEAAEVNQKIYDGYYSSGKTCEMMLSQAVGKEYESILKLVDQCS